MADMGESGGVLGLFLRELTAMLPELAVYIGGIILAIILWHRAPRAALLVVLGLSVLLAEALIGALISSWLSESKPEADTLFLVLSLFRSLVRAGGLCLVLAGVFVGRSRPQPVPRPVYEARPLAPPPPGEPSPHVTPERPRTP
jgi:hypothetical protein